MGSGDSTLSPGGQLGYNPVAVLLVSITPSLLALQMASRGRARELLYFACLPPGAGHTRRGPGERASQARGVYRSRMTIFAPQGQ